MVNHQQTSIAQEKNLQDHSWWPPTRSPFAAFSDTTAAQIATQPKNKPQPNNFSFPTCNYYISKTNFP
jgi:hypothetical protein